MCGIMNCYTHIDFSAPSSCWSFFYSVTELYGSGHDKSVIDQRLPICQAISLQTGSIEFQVFIDLTPYPVALRADIFLNDVNGD
jgi:hypothetical protein